MKKITLCLFSLILFGHLAYSQGCNDAGFCTIGDMKPGQQADSGRSEIGISTLFRLGEKETMLFSLQVQGSFHLWKSAKFSVQAPFQFIYGNLGFVTGAGDIAPAFVQELYKKDSTKLSFTLGGKIPANNANIQKNNEALPMAYQPSQGTWDGIAGISLFYKSWHFAIAYQHNFNPNQNRYIDSLKTNYSDVSYFDSRKIDRGDDVLIRIEKFFQKKGKSKYFVSLLPIYRLQEATIESVSGQAVNQLRLCSNPS